MFDLGVGRAGEDSREGLGEFEAEVVRLGWSRFVGGMAEAAGSRRGLVEVEGVADVVDVDGVEAVATGGSLVSLGPADCRVALGAAAEGRSSMVEGMSEWVLHSEGG